jgi:integrase
VRGASAKLQQARLVACRASERLRVPALVALFTGMRLSEVLALRWRWVDLDKAVISVREALAPTKVHGIRFKAPKSKAGRSEITIHACRFPCSIGPKNCSDYTFRNATESAPSWPRSEI